MVNATQPGLLAPALFNIAGSQYAVAFFSDNSYVLPPGAIQGASSNRARPGDTVVLYGVGLGPVTPATSGGQIARQASSLKSDLQVTIGGLPATVQYAGLAVGYVGLYQLNITVPNVPASDLAPLRFTLGGVSGSQTLYIAVQN